MFYEGIQSESGKIIPESEAYAYALERSLHGSQEDQQAFQDELVEWFYSGDWVKREDDKDAGFWTK